MVHCWEVRAEGANEMAYRIIKTGNVGYCIYGAWLVRQLTQRELEQLVALEQLPEEFLRMCRLA